MSELVEAEEVKVVWVWLRGRWRGSECRVSVGGTVVVIVSSNLVAVMQVL